jgi:sugar/nucleoside kinase (ribokinase family)
MYDLISIGDITVDLFFKGQSLTQKDDRFYLAVGGKYICDFFYESVGGGGANVATGCANFGLNTAVLGKVGENSFKQIIIQKLIKKGVSTEFLLNDEEYLNISTILLTQAGDRSIIHYLTPQKPLQLTGIIKQHLLKTKMVYMGNLPDVSIVERKQLLKHFKENNIPICLNLGVTDCRRPLKEVFDLIQLANIFIINTHEFSDLIKKDYEKINWQTNLLKFINFTDQILILTDGERGSYLYYQNNVIHQEAIKPKKIVDSTGAGDAFTSGFLSSYFKEKNPIKALKTASEYASRILEKMGGN